MSIRELRLQNSRYVIHIELIGADALECEEPSSTNKVTLAEWLKLRERRSEPYR